MNAPNALEAIRSRASAESRPALTVIAATYAIRLLRGMSSGWLGPFVPVIAASLSLSLVNVAFMFSVYFSGLFLMLAGGPFLLSRFGGKSCMTIAAVSYGLGFAVIAAASDALMLWAGSLLLGLAAGLSIPCGTLCVVKLSRSNAGTALSRYAVLYGIGALLGPLIAWASMGTPWSYQGVYAFGCVCALAIALVFALVRGVEIKDEASLKQRATLALSPHLWFFALLLFFYIGVESSAAAWMFIYLRESCTLDVTFASLGMTALWTGLTVGRIVSGELCKRFGHGQIIVGALVLAASSLSVLLARPVDPAGALALVLILGLGFGPVFPNVIAAGTSKYPAGIGAATSMMMMLGVTGGIFFPWLTGLIGQDNQMHSTIGVLFLILVGIALVMLGRESLSKPFPARAK